MRQVPFFLTESSDQDVTNYPLEYSSTVNISHDTINNLLYTLYPNNPTTTEIYPYILTTANITDTSAITMKQGPKWASLPVLISVLVILILLNIVVCAGCMYQRAEIRKTREQNTGDTSKRTLPVSKYFNNMNPITISLIYGTYT